LYTPFYSSRVLNRKVDLLHTVSSSSCAMFAVWGVKWDGIAERIVVLDTICAWQVLYYFEIEQDSCSGMSM